MNMTSLLVVAAVVGAFALSNYNAIMGGVAGIILTVGFAVWGWTAYEQGGGMTFFAIPVSRPVLLGILGVLTLLNVMQVVRGLRRRGR